MVLHDWRAVLRSAPADGKAGSCARTGEAQELLLPPTDSAEAQRPDACTQIEHSRNGLLL
jgi:hypothetical protein